MVESIGVHLLDSERNNMKRSYLMFRPEDVEISDDGKFEGIVIWQEN